MAYTQIPCSFVFKYYVTATWFEFHFLRNCFFISKICALTFTSKQVFRNDLWERILTEFSEFPYIKKYLSSTCDEFLNRFLTGEISFSDEDTKPFPSVSENHINIYANIILFNLLHSVKKLLFLSQFYKYSWDSKTSCNSFKDTQLCDLDL